MNLNWHGRKSRATESRGKSPAVYHKDTKMGRDASSPLNRESENKRGSIIP